MERHREMEFGNTKEEELLRNGRLTLEEYRRMELGNDEAE
jgi:hypothetical protein